MIAAFAPALWAALMLRALPAPLHRALDAWAERTAKARAQSRRARWAAAKAPQPVAAPAYKLKPWRD